MELTVKERVQNGAAWLDEFFPGWEDRIDLGTLQLEDGEHCICGQVFEGYDYWYNGYKYAENHLFTQANMWLQSKAFEQVSGYDYLNASILMGFTVPRDEYTKYNDGRVYDSESGSMINLNQNPFIPLQEAWVELLKERAVNRIMEEYTIK